MKRTLLTLTALATLAGCATDPSKIAGVYNAGACTSKDRAQLAALYKQQKDAAVGDAIGVILLGVPVASLAGKDQEAKIAILKGRCGG